MKFRLNSEYVTMDLTKRLSEMVINEKIFPYIICLGSDKVLSDSLGVFVGTILKFRHISTEVFGDKVFPISAIELLPLITELKNKDKNRKIIIVDSALSQSSNDIIIKDGGASVYAINKKVGDIAILGTNIMQKNGKILLANARLKDVLNQATVIANALCNVFCYHKMAKAV